MAPVSMPAAYARRLVAELEQRQIDSTPLLQEVGITISQLRNGECSLDRQRYLQLVALATETATATQPMVGLGLEVGLSTQLSDHGLLGYAIMSSKNVEQVLQRLLRFYRLSEGVLELGWQERPDGVFISARIPKDWPWSPVVAQYLVEEWLGNVMFFGRLMKLYDWIDELHLNWAQPKDGAAYLAQLNFPVVFNSVVSGVLFNKNALALPLRVQDEEAAAICEQQCELVLNELDSKLELSAKLHRLMARSTGEIPSMETVANKFGMTTRTLRRKLLDENVTYKDLVLEFKLSMAKAYLSNTRLSANEIGQLIGYGDTPSFYRAFKKAVGKTPDQYRR